MSDSTSTPQPYKPNIKRELGISPLWILPLITLALAGWLVINAVNDAGQRIQIYFSNAQGLIAGRTTIQYQGLEVGMVRDISLSDNLDNIYVDADIYPQATKLLGKNTRFWLVKPSASISGISGLDALVSGNYIAIQPGAEADETDITTKYVALENRPADLNAEQGLNLILRSRDLGSISVGSQIVYKQIPIGEVYSYKLDDDAKTVLIKAYIKNEYGYLITNKSRFWNVSGAGAQIGFNGIDVQFDSLSALLAGAIAVDSPDGGEPVKDNSQFRLYPDLKTAGRGIPIKIDLPDGNNISPGGAPIMYRGIEIGQVTDLTLTPGRKNIVASAAIQPAFSDMLKDGTKFLLEEANLSLNGIDNLSNLVRGNFLTLVAGDGEQARHFKAVRKTELLQEQDKSVLIKLVSDNSYGLEVGTDIRYRGVIVGTVSDIKLVDNQVIFTALIENTYQALLKSKNRFFVSGNVRANLTESGLDISLPPIKQILVNSINFISDGDKAINDSYPLYGNQSLAELATNDKSGSQNIVLFADELPSISKGSPLLYRNLTVGKVADFALAENGVKITVQIENRYKHLITKDTVFWNRSAVEVDASLQGVSIKAAPIEALLKGGISFDAIPGVENKLGDNWRLYDNVDQARQYGKTIHLVTANKIGFSQGTPIKFQGIPVGEVSQLTPNFDSKTTDITARIFPEYANKIAKNGSYFWVVSPKVSMSGIENVDSLVSPYIGVETGSGAATDQFVLHATENSPNHVSFTLQSEHRNSIDIGTPVLYRDIEVGNVTDIKLGNFSDRVISTIDIDKEYAYLVRENTVFWNVSGVDVSVGISGAKIRAGTVDSLIRGGIAFATPETSNIQPIAKPEQTFILHPKMEDEWRQWRTAIPKP